MRQKWQARDGLCGIEAFRVWVYRVFPLLFGMRMCPFCPYCNHSNHHGTHVEWNAAAASNPCQDMFGSSMIAVGGFCGGSDAWGAAIEHQHDGNPHFHAHVHIVNLYQYGNLKDVMAAIRAKTLDPKVIQTYHMALCSEEHPDVDNHNSKLPGLRQE